MRFQPYQKLAIVYDKTYTKGSAFYSNYAIFIKKIIKKNKIKSASILDIACGTGELIKKLKRGNIEIEGLDSSIEMIRIAKGKNKGVKFYVQNLTNFCTKKKYNVIICTFDSINYITTKENLSRTFKSVTGHLGNGGIFIFDFNTVYKKIRKTFSKDNIGYFNKIKDNYWEITIQIKDGRNIYEEKHRERLYSLKEMNLFASENKLNIIEVYAGFNNRVGSPDKYPRLIVVAKKQGKDGKN